jgi:hypothetical protein
MDDCLSCEDRLSCYTELAKESRQRERIIEYYKAQTEEAEAQLGKCLDDSHALYKELSTAKLAISVLRQAIRLTQEYVGDELMPPLEGWDWYDALKVTEKYDTF